MVIYSSGTTPDIDKISFSERFWFLKELAVCKVLMLLLRSPSDILINVSNTESFYNRTFSLEHINFNLSNYASFDIGENLNFTHLDAKGSMILLM